MCAVKISPGISDLRNIVFPVICDKPKCNTVWFTKSPIGGGGWAEIGSFKLGPCPTCGDYGSVPDGDYTPVQAVLFKSTQWSKIVTVLGEIQQIISKGGGVEQINETIENQDDWLVDWLKGFVPKTVGDLVQYSLLIGMIYGAWIICTAVDPPEKIPVLNNEVAEIIQRLIK